MSSDNAVQIFWAITIAAVVGCLTFGGIQCEKIHRESFDACVKETQKPLECKARVAQ